MACKRMLIAVVILLAATYMKFFLPELAEEVLPSLRQQLAAEDLTVSLPQEALAWLDWN